MNFDNSNKYPRINGLLVLHRDIASIAVNFLISCFHEERANKKDICSGYFGYFIQPQCLIQGGFKNQLQQLMFSSDFGEFHIMQELSVNLYR